MKYIISEQRLGRIVNRYLDDLGFTEGNDDADGFDIIRGGSQVLAYRNEEERLYISTDLIKDPNIQNRLNSNLDLIRDIKNLEKKLQKLNNISILEKYKDLILQNQKLFPELRSIFCPN